MALKSRQANSETINPEQWEIAGIGEPYMSGQELSDLRMTDDVSYRLLL